MPKEKQIIQWSTEAELAFVQALGTHRPGAPCAPEAVPLPERLTLLRQYQAAMRRRTRWGAIDPATLGAEVARLITTLEQRCPRPEAA